MTLENLTRDYLNSLALTLSREQKQRIIEINSQKGWIIFNAGSLRGQREIYNIDSWRLRELLHQQIKTYHQRNWKDNFWDGKNDDYINSISLDNLKITHFYWPRDKYFSPTSEKWIAVDKKALGDSFGSATADIDNVDLTMGKLFIKIERRRLEDLLNDPQIKNSTPPLQAEEDETNSPPPSTYSIQFVVEQVSSLDEAKLFIKIKLASPLVVNGTQTRVKIIMLNGEIVKRHFLAGDFATGNTISLLRAYPFGIGDRETLNIGSFFTQIQVNSSDSGSKENESPPPETPSADSISFIVDRVEKKGENLYRLTPRSAVLFRGEQINKVVIRQSSKFKTLFQSSKWSVGKSIIFANLNLAETFWTNEVGKLTIINDSNLEIQTFYTEVRAKNAELAQMEKSLVDLASELLAAIQKNQAVCQSARKLGLNLPEVSPDSLNYFRENFFADLDEQLPLTDPINQGIIAANQAIQKSKENIKINVTKTCATNLKKLTDYQNKKPTSNSPLDQLKSSAIEAINQILTDKDNLRNIDWSTLANGKYLNWEEDLLELSSENEVVAYRENFLATLKEFLAQQKNEEPRKNHSPIDLSRIDNTPSLSEARNLARRLIWQLFAKYQVEAKDLESQDRDWVNHLAQLNSRSQIKHFVQELEKKFQQKSGRLSPSDPAPSSPFFTWLLIGSFLVVALVLFIGLIRSSQKKVK